MRKEKGALKTGWETSSPDKKENCRRGGKKRNQIHPNKKGRRYERGAGGKKNEFLGVQVHL